MKKVVCIKTMQKKNWISYISTKNYSQGQKKTLYNNIAIILPKHIS